jgi:hypothetical protein
MACQPALSSKFSIISHAEVRHERAGTLSKYREIPGLARRVFVIFAASDFGWINAKSGDGEIQTTNSKDGNA